MMYYIASQGVRSGPFPEEEVRQKLARGEIRGTDLCWREGWSNWQSVSAVFTETAQAGAPPPPLVTAPASNPFTAPPARQLEPPKTSALAITSLICGILGLLLVPFALVAIVCGHIARSNIKNSGGTIGGAGVALGGLITGYLGLVAVFFIGLLAAMAIPAFKKVRDTSIQKTIHNNLVQLNAAAEQYMLENDKTEAQYADLVGPGKLITTLKPVAGEDYTEIIIHKDDRIIRVWTRDGKTVELRR